MGRPAVDMTGKKFGNLTVVKQTGTTPYGLTWLCQCACGKKRVVHGHNLRAGHTRGCGRGCTLYDKKAENK